MINCPQCKKKEAKVSRTYPDIMVCYCGGTTLKEVGLVNKTSRVDEFIDNMASLYFSELRKELNRDEFNYCAFLYKQNTQPSDRDYNCLWEETFLCPNVFMQEIFEKQSKTPDVWNLPPFLKTLYPDDVSVLSLFDKIFYKSKKMFENC